MADPRPAGTVTLVFTDIAGSTRLLEELGDEYATLLDDHHRIVSAAAEEHGGSRVDAAGDGLFYSFATARGALLACLDVQRALTAHSWPRGADVQVRMGVHTGEPLSAMTGYVGMDVHRAARISAAGHGGQILVSQAARALIGTALPDGVTLRDLGEHRLKDLAQPERLFQVVAPGLASEFPPIRSLETLPNNLPRQLSSFVGRGREMADAMEQLSATSILTMTGPGGVGKTRLALEVGAHQIDAFADGVWFVELGALNEGDLVPEALASTLRIKPQPGVDPLATLVEALGPRRLLLILDNCEHLLDPVVRAVDRLLHTCPDLKILATSREALGLPGESLMPVPSMSLPVAGPSGDGKELERLSDCDAVRLFVDRARSVAPGFSLGLANAEAIAQICTRLDGIPLAVELSAARVKALPPHQIAARLDDRFRLLTGGSRTALPRHRTLRAAMDWSFDLLSAAERATLTRLSVFAGSVSLEAAEAICSGGPVEGDEVLDLLSHLIDKSLLMQEDDPSEARFRMLETIRDYAHERLAESEDATSVHARHRDWFVALVDRARSAFFAGPEQAAWLARLSAEHDNLRAALQWTHEDPGGAAAELRLAAGLWRFWEIGGNLAEGSSWLQRALERTGGEVSALRAHALTGAGMLAGQRGDHAAATAFHEASLLLHRELGNPASVAAACNNVASAAIEQGDLDRARTLYQEAIELSSATSNAQWTALTIMNLADLAARQGGDAEADDLYARAIGTFEANGDLWGVAQATSRMAEAGRRRGDVALARQRYQEALALYRRIGDGRGAARTLASLGNLAADDGDIAAAEALYREGLSIRHQLGDRAGVASIIERMAWVAADRPERAARLLGMAAALRESIGSAMSPAAAAELDQYLASLGESMGSEALRAAMEDGRRTTLSAALAYATETPP